MVSDNKINEVGRTFTCGTPNGTVNTFSMPPQASSKCSQGNISFSSDSFRSQRNETDRGKTLLSDDIRTVKTSTVPNLANIKIEPPSYDEFQNSSETTLGQMSFGNFVLVKNEVHNADDACEDELDHMLLRERMKLLPKLNTYMPPPAPECRPFESKRAPSVKINRPRKRRKTAT